MRLAPAPSLPGSYAVCRPTAAKHRMTFTEALRGYFHGRDEEADELLRRVQRKDLTVLFGQSGLGKSSLLQAGLFPKVR